jgi:hypothetical protein
MTPVTNLVTYPLKAPTTPSLLQNPSWMAGSAEIILFFRHAKNIFLKDFLLFFEGNWCIVLNIWEYLIFLQN